MIRLFPPVLDIVVRGSGDDARRAIELSIADLPTGCRVRISVGNHRPPTWAPVLRDDLAFEVVGTTPVAVNEWHAALSLALA